MPGTYSIGCLTDGLRRAKDDLKRTEEDTKSSIREGQRAQKLLDDATAAVKDFEDAIAILENKNRESEVEV